MTAEHVIIAVSALGGIVGGMGMGGGTLLIPLLTLAAGVEQHMAQAINLFAFIPMSVIALVIHARNGYVSLLRALSVAGLAAFGAVAGSMLAGAAGGYVLRAAFGAFLVALGVAQLIAAVRGALKKRAQKWQGHQTVKNDLQNADTMV